MSTYAHDRAASVHGTVLIASADLLAAWSAVGASIHEVLAVSQDDVSAALNIIRRRQPAVVVLEEAFGVSSRASSLVARLQTDPEFRHVEVRLLPAEGAAAVLAAHAADGHPRLSLAALARPMPLRYAARVSPASPVEILVSGSPAQLVNLSASGTQVCSRARLRPEQRISVHFLLDTGAIRLPGVVVWSTFELAPKPSYRAGIRLMGPFPLATEEILARLRPLPEDYSSQDT